MHKKSSFYFAKAIATIFNPIFLLIPTPFLLLYKASSDIGFSLYWTAYSAMYIGLFGLFLIYGVRKGYFSDVDVSKRQQRPLLFMFAAALMLLDIVLLIVMHGPKLLIVEIMTILFGLLVISEVNRHIKASVHVAGITSFLLSIELLYGGANILVLLLIPLVAWARIKTHNHTIQEVVVGGTLGVSLTLFFYFVFKYIIPVPLAI